jgi:hypothetical protein
MGAKVDALHHALGRVQAAQPRAHSLVQQAVVLDDSQLILTEQANRAHRAHHRTAESPMVTARR